MQVFTSFSYPFTVAGALKMKAMPVPTLRFLQWVLYPAFDIYLSSADMSPAFLTLAEAPSWIVRLQSSLLWTGALGLVEAQVLLVFFFWHFSCLHVSRAICFHCCTLLSLPRSEVGELQKGDLSLCRKKVGREKQVYLMGWKTNFTDKTDVWSYPFVTSEP